MKKLTLALAFWLLSIVTATAQIINGAYPNTFVNGTVIDATQVNANFNYAQSQANSNAAKNGTNSDITALTALATPLTPAQGGSNIYYAGTATGTANAIVVASPTPINFTLVAGKTVRFIAAATNTGATTLAAGGTIATNVFRQTPAGIVALSGGEIIVGTLVECYYDGTQYQLLNSIPENGGFGGLTVVPAAATVDLGLTPSHYINLSATGPTIITSFGTSASNRYPAYLVRNSSAFDITIRQGTGLEVLGSGDLVLRGNTGDQVLMMYYGAAGWFMAGSFPRHPRYAPTQANALTIKNNAVTPNTKIDITASEIVMDNSSGGNYYTESYGTCTIDLTINGTGGLDTGVIAADTWYYLYAIGSGSATSCLASTSSTAPTLPTGYVFKMRVGATTTGASSTLRSIIQRGNKAQYTSAASYSVITGASGNVLTPGWTAVQVTGNGFAAPNTATEVFGACGSKDASVATMCAPNSGYLGLNTTLFARAPTVQSSASGTSGEENMFSYVLESNSLYYAANGANSVMRVKGWVDQVNAS